MLAGRHEEMQVRASSSCTLEWYPEMSRLSMSAAPSAHKFHAPQTLTGDAFSCAQAKIVYGRDSEAERMLLKHTLHQFRFVAGGSARVRISEAGNTLKLMLFKITRGGVPEHVLEGFETPTKTSDGTLGADGSLVVPYTADRIVTIRFRKTLPKAWYFLRVVTGDLCFDQSEFMIKTKRLNNPAPAGMDKHACAEQSSNTTHAAPARQEVDCFAASRPNQQHTLQLADETNRYVATVAPPAPPQATKQRADEVELSTPDARDVPPVSPGFDALRSWPQIDVSAPLNAEVEGLPPTPEALRELKRIFCMGDQAPLGSSEVKTLQLIQTKVSACLDRYALAKAGDGHESLAASALGLSRADSEATVLEGAGHRAKRATTPTVDEQNKRFRMDDGNASLALLALGQESHVLPAC